tara:strand:+ start:63 stop:524 length:462 start_codon:yes stop_codon:yes gene_type:complete
MKYKYYNGFCSDYFKEELEIIERTPFHTKVKDRKKVFSQTPTNDWYKEKLIEEKWKPEFFKKSPYGEKCDFYKNSTIIEVQFGKYFSLYKDILHLEWLYEHNIISSVIYITACKQNGDSILIYNKAEKAFDYFLNKKTNIPVLLVGLHWDNEV